MLLGQHIGILAKLGWNTTPRMAALQSPQNGGARLG